MKRTLLLVPTQYELSMIDPDVLRTWNESNLGNAPLESVGPSIQANNRSKYLSDSIANSSQQISIALCGFGLVIAGARTAQLIAALRPDHVILMGIAGRLGSTLKVGDAYYFSEVSCYGIGAGTGQGFKTSSDLGWMHWNGDDATTSLDKSVLQISDRIKLNSTQTSRQSLGNFNLLSVTSASGDDADTKLKLNKYPDAVAEDMEGFSVAAACQIADVPLNIVRGISNQAGDRNHNNWRVREAMQSVAALVNDILVSKEVDT